MADGPSSIRARATSAARRHPRTTAAAVAGGLALAVFLAAWFQPWKLFVDQVVDEGVPAIATSPDETQGSETPTASRRVLSEGRFRSLEHRTTGTAQILLLPDGRRVLRLQDLDTSNGPDLIVMLSATPATEDGWRAYDDDAHLSLGALKGNKGSQNYAIPASVDLARYRSVVVWCRRFTVGFGAAPIALRD